MKNLCRSRKVYELIYLNWKPNYTHDLNYKRRNDLIYFIKKKNYMYPARETLGCTASVL